MKTFLPIISHSNIIDHYLIMLNIKVITKNYNNEPNSLTIIKTEVKLE